MAMSAAALMQAANLDQDLVVIINESDQTLEFPFANKRYSFPPHSSSVAPIGLARLWFGHWEIVDPVMRKEELERLQVKWGSTQYLAGNTVPPMPVKVMTLNGEQIMTVLDAPHSPSAQSPIVSGPDEVVRLKDQIKAMSEMLVAMNEKLSAGATSLDKLPQDTDTLPKKNGRNGNGGTVVPLSGVSTLPDPPDPNAT